MLLVFVWLVPASFIVYVIVCFWFLWLVVIGCRHYLRSGARNCCKVVKISQRKGHVPGICQSLSLRYLSSFPGASNHSYIFVHIRTISPETDLQSAIDFFCFGGTWILQRPSCVLSLKQCSNLHPAWALGCFIFPLLAYCSSCELENLPLTRWLWEMTSLCKVHISSLRVWTLTEWRAVCSHAGKIRNFSDEAHLLEKKALAGHEKSGGRRRQPQTSGSRLPSSFVETYQQWLQSFSWWVSFGCN